MTVGLTLAARGSFSSSLIPDSSRRSGETRELSYQTVRTKGYFMPNI